MKISLIIAIFCLNIFAVNLPTHKCSKEALSVLKKWNSEDYWSRRGKSLFISPTDDFGRWVYFKIGKENTLTLTKTDKKNNLKVHFNKNCQSEMKVEDNQANKNFTDDQKLKKMIASGKGLMYFWSPNMPLSEQQIKFLEDASKKHGLRLLTFVEPNHQLGKNKQKSSYYQQLDAMEFKHRNVYIHYPTILAFENGKIKNKIKYGYENKQGFVNDIKKFFDL